MTSFHNRIAVAVLCALITCVAVAQPAPSGEWMITASVGIGQISFRADAEATDRGFRFRPKGTGMLQIKSGSYSSGKILMDAVVPLGEATMSGTFSGGVIRGEWRTKSGQSRGGWSAEPAKPWAALTSQQRESIIEKLWTSIRDVYVFFNDKKLNYDETKAKFFAKSVAAASDLDFFNELRYLIAELNDGHASLVVNPLGGYVGKAPFECKLAEGRVVITKLITECDASVGDEIVMVDGKPVRDVIVEIAKARAFPVASVRTARAASSIGGGTAGESLKLSVNRGAEKKELTIRRIEAGPNAAGKTETRYRDLGDGLAMISIESFLAPEVGPNFDAALEKAKDARGLILDLRGNGGGNLFLTQRILSRLIGNQITGTAVWNRDGNGGLVATDLMSGMISVIKPGDGAPSFKGKVAVLSDEFCFSAAELFLVVFRENKMGRIFGRQSGGGAGAVAIRKLDPEGYVAFSNVEIRGAKGTRVETVGVIPDETIPLTVDECLGRKDPTLDAARTWLKRELAAQSFHLMPQPMLDFWSALGWLPSSSASKA